VRTPCSYLFPKILVALAFSGLACGGGSGNDAGPSGGDGGGADGGLGALDQTPTPADAAPASVDQSSPADEAASAIDQAVPSVDLGATKLDGAVGVEVRAGDAPASIQADGKLLLAGLVENPGGNQDFAVMRQVKQPGW
jgi:hypothetical protein